MASEEEWMELVRATEMLLTDVIPREPTDAIYLPGLSEGMIASGGIFDLVVALHNVRASPRITFNGSDGRGMPPQDQPGAAWPGKEWYLEEFTKRGVMRSLLTPTQPGLHTRGEQNALVALAKERRWRRIVIVTVPWHFVRVFTCLIAAMKEQDYWFAAYAKAAETNWYVPLKGSQGVKETTPFDESLPESQRVHKYHDSGFSAPFAELFLYLKSRESVAS